MTTDRPTIFDHERARIRTLEAELAQAREDARVLAQRVQELRYEFLRESGNSPGFESHAVQQALERNKP